MKILLKTIQTFADKDTADFFYAKRKVKKWEKITKKASKVLPVLNSITDLSELNINFMETEKVSIIVQVNILPVPCLQKCNYLLFWT